ncbi:MAG: roadblock/LC7 domain-containing protein [Candidatus Thorarchaeota archaeon]|nr:roadblock/LC7 domain-containing protein [Candidatus Thorarchaeota archaeon]MCK5238799.1 roadblock/LC7 domain-containing protein [Candidatus Thorarchaeota archaeon]
MSSIDPIKEKELVELLMGLTNYADLDAIAVVSKQGVKLAYFATEESDADPDLMAAVSAALLVQGEMASEKLGLSELYEVVVRGKDGFIVLSHAGDFLIMGSARDLTSMGLAVTQMRKYAKEIGKLLEN